MKKNTEIIRNRILIFAISMFVIIFNIRVEVLAINIQESHQINKNEIERNIENAIDIQKIQRKCSQVISFKSSMEYVYALLDTGELYYWGGGSKYGSGYENSDCSLAPVLMANKVKYIEASGEWGAFISDDNSLYVWGGNGYGQLGLGELHSSIPRLEPYKLMENVKSVYCSQMGGACITLDGDLYNWGRDAVISLGHGENRAFCMTPTFLAHNVKTILDMQSYITEDGELYAWNQDKDNIPKYIMSNVKDADVSNEVKWALTKTNDLYVWGTNNGYIGTGTTGNVLEPTKIFSNIKRACVMDNADYAVTGIALSNNGEIYTWGNAGWNFTPVPSEKNGSSKIPVILENNVRDFYFDGSNYLWIITNDYKLYLMGDITDSVAKRLGCSFEGNDAYPQFVSSGISDIFLGSFFSDPFAFKSTNGKLLLAGYNGNGELGNGTYEESQGLQILAFPGQTPDACSVVTKPNEIIVQVKNEKGFLLNNATVKIGSMEIKTNENGLSTFSNISDQTVTINVQMIGYLPKTEDFNLAKCGNLCEVIMCKEGLNKATLIYNGNQYNLLKEEKKIREEDKNTNFQIYCESAESLLKSIKKYTIEQRVAKDNYSIVKESKDGEFLLQTQEFKAGKKIFICSYDINNQLLYRTPINLNIIKKSKNVVKSEIDLGKDLTFTVDKNIPIFAGKKISLKGLTAMPVYTEITDEKIKVGFNINIGKLGTDENTKNRKWIGIKECFKKSILGRGDSLFDDIEKYSEKTYTLAQDPKIGVAIAGYAEGPINGEKLNGKLYVSLSFSWSGEKSVCNMPPIVVVYDIVGTVSSGGETTFSFVNSEFEGDIFVDGSVKLNIFGGLGLPYLVSLGVYGKGEMSAKYIIIPKEISGFEYWKVRGELGVQLRYLGKEGGSVTLLNGEDYYLYKRDKLTTKTSISLNINDNNAIEELTNMNNYKTIAHDQIACVENESSIIREDVTVSKNSISSNTTEVEIDKQQAESNYANNAVLSKDWIGQIAMDKSDVNLKVVQTPSYIDSMPQLVRCGNDVIMLYLDDYPARNAQNASTLMFSLYDEQNNSWSMPQTVCDDGTADYNPVVYSDGEKFSVMWNNSNIIVQDGKELSLAETASATDLYKMTYDVNTKCFVDGKQITNDGEKNYDDISVSGVFEKSATFTEINGKSYYAWIENDKGNVFGLEGTNSIILAEDYGDTLYTVNVTDVNSAILDLKIGTVNNKIYLAYIYDEDGNLSDSSDSQLVVLDVTSDIGEEQTIFKGNMGNIQFDIYNGENVLLWSFDGKYFSWNGEQVTQLFEEKLIPESTSQYFTGENGKQYIGFVKEDEKGVNGYLIQYNTSNKKWEYPVQITETENYVEQLNSIAWNGKIISVYNLVEANFQLEDNWVKSCKLGSVLVEEYSDLSILNVEYLAEDFQKNSEFPLNISVQNQGMQVVNNIRISLLNEEKEKISEESLTVNILSGETKEVEVKLQIPDYVEGGEYYISVENVQVDVKKKDSDNIYKIKLGVPNFQVTAHLNMINEYYIIAVSITNKGIEDGGGKLVIKNYNSGEDYYFQDINTVAAGEHYNIEIPIQNIGVPNNVENVIHISMVSNDEQEVEENAEAYVNIIPYDEEEESENSSASSDTPNNNQIKKTLFEYVVLKDGTLEITGALFSGSKLEIPAIINGMVVTGIGKKAFYANTSLEEIVLPNGLKNLGERAFMGCSKLKSISLPNSLERLGNFAFENCTSLTYAKLNTGRINIVQGVFAGCTSLKNVVIGNKVKTIRTEAFKGCSSLTEINLPISVVLIEKNAFLNSGIKRINYTGLKKDWNKINIVAEGNYAITEATVLAKDESFIPRYMVKVGRKYQIESGKYRVTAVGSFPTVAYIGVRNKNIKTIKVPNIVKIGGTTYRVTSIDSKAAYNCKKLSKLVIGNNVKNIGSNAFGKCEKLKSVVLGKNVNIIGNYAFNGCKSLTQISLPAKVKKIGKRAFYNCKKLKRITIKGKKTSRIGAEAFKGIKKNATIKVPKDKKDYYTNLLKRKINSDTRFK